MFIIHRTTMEDLTHRIATETEAWEKRKEKVQKWSESIDMHSVLAPSAGSRTLL
ncbi:hypothetical protein NEOKW01_1102 [Nematocida sp. AWRm80]|nr:hypothetical protein NEOKW01_1102 [Nematocida sp. AWRm80]